MGHESRIEPWLPMTTVLLVSFRTDWLRREDTMKTAWKETGNRWAAVFSIRMDGAAGQNRTCSSTWGWKQEKFQRWRKCFLFASPSIKQPPCRKRRGFLRPLGLFSEMASVGSSHNRPTSAEDHEEALLLGCPPIGRLDRSSTRNFGLDESILCCHIQKNKRALYPRLQKPRLYGPQG